jgi:phosphate:Na+ symporter
LEILASFLGGLGLFLAGVKGVGTQLQQMAGRRMRLVITRATGGGISAALTGTLLGTLTQSSNAVTFIATSMVQAGLLPLVRALPVVAWANLGTAVLVLVASLDLRLAALWLLGCAGCALAFGLDGRGRWKAALGAAFHLGMVFLGLVILKAGAAPLRESEAVREAMAFAGHSLLPPFLMGALVTLVAQSSSTVTILAIALAGVGLLDGPQAGMAVCGASLGSGLSVMLLSGGLRGTARRLALFQTLFKALGSLLFVLPFLAWKLWPNLPTPWDGVDLPHQLGFLFVALQAVPALAIAPFMGLFPGLLARLAPATQEEELSRPIFLYDQALEDAPTALSLVEREQARLLERLPGLLDTVREDAPPPALPVATVSAAGVGLEQAIAAFLQSLLGRGCRNAELQRAVALDNTNGLIGALRETVAELSGVLEQAARRGEADPISALVPALAETLHLLLSELHDAALSGDAEDVLTLRRLAADRSDMMDGVRRRVFRAGNELAQGGHDLLFRATSLFERAVWLIRRTAQGMPVEAAEPPLSPG